MRFEQHAGASILMLDDDTFPRRICTHLGCQPEVSPHVAHELSQIRASALTRLGMRRRVWDQIAQWPSFRTGAGVALVMLGFAYAAWQMNSPSPDLANIDIELLTGELPPAAYLDPGFARVIMETLK